MIVDIDLALKKLNDFLAKEGKALEFVICGGALIYLSGYNSRPTQDVDVLKGFNEVLKQASKDIAEELGISEKWLNPHVEVFVEYFPEGWEDRVELVRNYSNLEVFGVSRQDLISNKLKSLLTREADRQDLILMKVSREEFDIAVSFVQSFPSFDAVGKLDVEIIEREIFDE
ncbi:hypothetical protein BALOs_1401 [Halobacteriovorax sp. BALOs_7]|uniref:DUF6036 family nucleotidyltransferase n=1 Tax=Halobacteriovorax sp. BALOs_7 TaxID=2109558 RepID=UPI000EB76883|nr:DUF6036 family nucleotidyltransferase [Halobacteriovorax sp. BALOs_7]AYF44402.1 hypothetical protein BALOs_1401 [Halobacteriovorax sp. BALOs_7]